MKGRIPTPTKILEARGSWRAKTRTGEPQPAAGLPECAAALSPAERRIWDMLTGQLLAVGLLTVNDGLMIARYCTFFVNWSICKDRIAKDGMLLVVKADDPDKYMAKPANGPAITGFEEHPLLREFHRLDKAMKAIEVQFGLTPASRARMSINHEPESNDPMEALFKTSMN
jgi:P27 family predicted phage terminase small subunit